MKIDEAVATLRSYVQSKEKTPSAAVREAADDYQRACIEVNNSLNRLEDLLNRSLRTEAIQFANIEPKLEDLVSTLDFHGRIDYEMMAPFQDLPVPPPLDMETIKNLQTAYVEYQQTENLYRSLRKLVLERAPISERLLVMREISNHDRINATLIEDIVAIEKNVQGRIVQNIRKAANERNDDALEEHIDEYYLNNWTTPPSPEVLQTVEKYRGVYLEKRLKTLANRAFNAIHSKDLQSAKKHYAEWVSQAKAAGVQKGDQYWARIEPVVHWIENYDQIESVREYAQVQLLTLRSAIQAPVAKGTAEETIKNLNAAMIAAEEAIENFNNHIPSDLRQVFPKMTIPKDLVMEYQKCLEKLSEHSRKNELFILAGLFAGGALLIIAFLVWVVARSR